MREIQVLPYDERHSNTVVLSLPDPVIQAPYNESHKPSKLHRRPGLLLSSPSRRPHLQSTTGEPDSARARWERPHLQHR
jgi:hypothetical protein